MPSWSPEVSKIDSNLLNELKIGEHQREDEGAGGSRKLWIALAVVLVLLAAAGGGWWFFSSRPVSVQTATAAAPASGGNAGAVLQATGYVTARRKATVSAQITGTLTAVLIEEGDVVKKDQVLARLEDSALAASLNAAKANANTSQAQVAQAEAQLAQAEADVRRQDALVARGMVAVQAAEQARTLAATTRAELAARRRGAEASQAQVRQAQVNFDYTVIRAPFAGVITEKAAQVGEIISPLSAGGGFTRTGVGTIVDMDSLEVDVDVNEAYIGQVKPDMPCESVLDAYPDWKIPSHVIAIVPAADRGKATVKVRVALEQKDGRLVPDMGVRVSFLEKKSEPTAAPPKGVLVPAQAIAERDGKQVVFVVADGRAQRHSVTPAAQDYGGMKLVPEGLAAGDRVIVSPPETLADGARVDTAKD
jgi:RND family efflux transporter MFP subunit